MSYIITTKAKQDLDDLWYYIAEDKVSAANKVENDIQELSAMIYLICQCAFG